MATQPQTQPEPVRIDITYPRWNFSSCLAFRFCFAYLGLYCLAIGLIPIPVVDTPGLATITPFRQIVFWTAKNLFDHSDPLVYDGSGSGDKTFDWVLTFYVFCSAVLMVALWSILDRRRKNYSALHKWFYLFLRLALGSVMVSYGMIKVVPLQMPFPSLTTLVEPFGNFSPMHVLWSSIGASPGYERFAGSMEVLGGMLLFVPRTTTFGALICLMNLTEVFILNMTYDVPVKLFSFHLILISLFLLAPELSRIVSLFFLDREIGPSTRPNLFVRTWANRVALVLQIAFGLVMIITSGLEARKQWYSYGGGAAKSPLYGIWNVKELLIGGGPAQLTEKEQWRRVIFDRPTSMAVQGVDDAFVFYRAAVDVASGAIDLTKPNENWKARLNFQRSGNGRLSLDGEMDGRVFRMQLELLDRSKLLLLNRGFHWIQEYPFNR